MGDAEKPQGSVSDAEFVTKQAALSEELVAMMSKPKSDQQASAERDSGAQAEKSDAPAGAFGQNEAVSAVRGTLPGPLGGPVSSPPMSALGIAPLGASGAGASRFGASPMQALGIPPIGSASARSSNIPPPAAYTAPPPVTAPPMSHTPEETPPDSGWGTDRPTADEQSEERPLALASASSEVKAAEGRSIEAANAAESESESEESESQDLDNDNAITEIDPSGGFFRRGVGSEPPEAAQTAKGGLDDVHGLLDAPAAVIDESVRTAMDENATDASVAAIDESVPTAMDEGATDAPAAVIDESATDAPAAVIDEIPPSAMDVSDTALPFSGEAPGTTIDQMRPSATDAPGTTIDQVRPSAPAMVVSAASAPNATTEQRAPIEAEAPAAAVDETTTTAPETPYAMRDATAANAPGATMDVAEVYAHVPTANPSWKGAESPGFDDVTVVTPPIVFGAHSEPTLVGAKVLPELLEAASPSTTEVQASPQAPEGAMALLPQEPPSSEEAAASSRPTQVRQHPAPELVVAGMVGSAMASPRGVDGSAAESVDDQAPPPGRSLHSKPPPKPISYHSVKLPTSAPVKPMGVTSASVLPPEPSLTGVSLKSKLLGTLWLLTIAGAAILGWYAAGASNEKKLAAASASAASAVRAAREAGAAEARAALAPLPTLLDLSVPPDGKSASEILKTEMGKRTRLDAVALGRQWQSKRFDEFNRFSAELRQSPQRLDDVKVRLSAIDFVNDRLTSRAALELLAELSTPRALDVLYAVWTGSKERNETTQLAEALLFAKDVRPRVSEALELALALREKPTSCPEIQRIVAKAIREGDRRSANLLVTTAARKNCGEAGAQDCIKCLEDVKDMRKAIRAAATRPEPIP